MSTQRYSVTPHPIETLLAWAQSGEIAIPEIQHPFVWDSTKVWNLLDSLYRGYLRTHCLPESLLDGEIPTYNDFLEKRRKLMALKIKEWFKTL